ncbi:unnamed protein product, partial [Polarella glacialis]
VGAVGAGPTVEEGWHAPAWTSRWRTHRSALLAHKDEEFESNARLAAYYVEDATEGRLDNGLASNFKSGDSQKFACCLVQTHIAWHAVVIAACVLHSLLVVFEPSPVDDGLETTAGRGRGWTNKAELLCVGVYAADISLKVAYMGAGTFLSLHGSKVWQTTYAALVVLLTLEALVAPAIQLSRPLRPIVLVLRSRSVRNFYMTVLRICPSLLKVCALLLFLLLTSALAMARFLRGTGTEHFSSSVGAFRELSVLLLTQDNYQSLLEDIVGHGGLASLLLFFAFVVVGILFLMQLVLGTVIDTYMEEAQKELRSKRVKQAKGLMRAFAVLDFCREGKIRPKAFDRLLQRLRPADSPFERQLKFSLLSNKYKAAGPCSLPPGSCPSTPGHRLDEASPLSPCTRSPLFRTLPQLSELSEQPVLSSLPPPAPEPTIDPIDFLSLHTVLELTFKPRRQLWDVPGVAGEQPWWSRSAESLLADWRYVLVQRVLMWLDAAVFLADAEVAKLFFDVELNDLMHAAFLSQVLLRVLARGSLRRAWRLVDGQRDLRGELLLAVGLTLASVLRCTGSASLGALRSLRLAASCSSLARFCQCLADIVPAMMQVLGLICVVQYTFAAVALEIFGRRGVPGFGTFPKAASALLQVLLGLELRMPHRWKDNSELQNYDVTLNDDPHLGSWDDSGARIVQHLAVKGFCNVKPLLRKGLLESVQKEAEKLDFCQVNSAIAEGLLGPEGSPEIAELDNLENRDALKEVDNMLKVLSGAVKPYCDRCGIQGANLPSTVVVHRADAEATSDQGDPALSDAEVSKWLQQFAQHRLMLILFVGPAAGVLRLSPYFEAEADPIYVRTFPGSIILLRPDVLSHEHSAVGAAYALSSFILQASLKRHFESILQEEKRLPLTPAARRLEAWRLQKLHSVLQARQEEEEDGSRSEEQVGQELPRSWMRAISHAHHRGQMVGVAGAASYLPSSHCSSSWFKASSSGPDFATEVPLSRWDHSAVYDPEASSWQRHKSYCMHGAFMEGVDLFDSKFFSLAAHESKNLDPHCRMLLEVGYGALAAMGFTKKSLLMAHGGVYVGCGNDEWQFCANRPMGLVTGALSLFSGRFSFCLGMKGPALTLQTEAASGLTATCVAAESVQRKGLSSSNAFAVAIGVHLMIAPMWWPSHCRSGWLSREGRCLTFNDTASGYVRGDGCAAVALKRSGSEEGHSSRFEASSQDDFLGIIAGAKMNTNGMAASLSSPHGPQEQEVMVEALRNACVSPLDVDGVEAFGEGSSLADAVELAALWRAHRGGGGLAGGEEEMHGEPFRVTAVKSSVGNQIECSGVTGFLKLLLSAKHGHATPNVHLRICNPSIEALEGPLILLDSTLEFPLRSTFNGVKSRGFGGTNVYLLSWGSSGDNVEDQKDPTEASQHVPQEPLFFWPGGGGEIADEFHPQPAGCFISVVGSWSCWQDVEPMEKEGEGIYGYTVTLGENRWEQFQLCLGGDRRRTLHPGRLKAPQGGKVFGPEEDWPPSGAVAAQGSSLSPAWLLDGRGQAQASGCELSAASGFPGDQYRIRFRIAGRWRLVEWDKVQPSPQSLFSALRADTSTLCPRGRYFLATDWSEGLQEMWPSPSDASSFYADVRLLRGSGEFQILRNADPGQVFYPDQPCAGGAGDAAVLGPDDEGAGLTWRLASSSGEEFRLCFQRRWVPEERSAAQGGQKEQLRVSWRTIDPTPRSDDEPCAESTSVVRAAVQQTHPLTGLYFLAYYTLAVLVVLNLVTALMIEFYRASLAENVELREQRQSEITRQVQDLLREMEV